MPNQDSNLKRCSTGTKFYKNVQSGYLNERNPTGIHETKWDKSPTGIPNPFENPNGNFDYMLNPNPTGEVCVKVKWFPNENPIIIDD